MKAYTVKHHYQLEDIVMADSFKVGQDKIVVFYDKGECVALFSEVYEVKERY